MQPPLVNDDVWTRRGISLLWDADQLSRLCSADRVISLRQFLQMHAGGWSQVQAHLVDEIALVVAGLDACLDALPPDEMAEWLQETLYAAVISFQREVAGGGNEAALIFWVVDHARLKRNVSEDAWSWQGTAEHRALQIPLSHCLFNGAQHDLKEILDSKGHCLGLFHPRIS
ncbi:MAG: hypothetical protein ACK5UC_08670 [Planctomycetaceae bacterium]|jgi:hypothetical protein